MRNICFLFVLICNSISLTAKPYVIFENMPNGFFSIFQMALSFCECYENGVIQGGHFDFKNKGFYYDEKKGPNWWEYYFEPIRLGSSEGGKIEVMPMLNCFHIELFNTRQQNHGFITRYIRIKPHIAQKVDDFVNQHFKGNYVIGVHYRGTDKLTVEATKISYDRVVDLIQKTLGKQNEKEKWIIFVATDEEPFLNYLTTRFPNKVVSLPDAKRSVDGKAIHFRSYVEKGKVKLMGPEDPYKNGEDALLDCLLLSRTNFLFRTSSNLSLISTYFNPELPVFELTHRQREVNGQIKGITHAMLALCRNKKDPNLYFPRR